MSFRFKPEDFLLKDLTSTMASERCATIANRLLDEHVKTLPEVFGEMIKDGKDIKEVGWSEIQLDSDRSRARLWGVEPIKPEECEHHEPDKEATHISWQNGRLVIESECKNCSNKLVAKWIEPEEK